MTTAADPVDPIDSLAHLWGWMAEENMKGYSPIYERIARAVADDSAILTLISSLPPEAHLPLSLLAAVHYVVLEGGAPELAEIYAGRSDADPAPLFIEASRSHWDEIQALLSFRHVQTNDCGRSALIGPGLTWLGPKLGGSPALVDVGASAGLALLCDRYRLDYGDRGTTGPEDSPVVAKCEVVAGNPPIQDRIPELSSQVGIDRSPIDVSKPEDARWLLACVWPDTGRLERTAASIGLAQSNPPTLVKGDANEVLPSVLAELPKGTPAVVLTTWALAYFSLEQRARFVEILEDASRTRPVAWLSLEGPGVVEAFADVPEEKRDDNVASLLGAIIFDHGTQHPEFLATAHPHGLWIDWRAPED
jgi:hypothetical protein